MLSLLASRVSRLPGNPDTRLSDVVYECPGFRAIDPFLPRFSARSSCFPPFRLGSIRTPCSVVHIEYKDEQYPRDERLIWEL